MDWTGNMLILIGLLRREGRAQGGVGSDVQARTPTHTHYFELTTKTAMYCLGLDFGFSSLDPQPQESGLLRTSPQSSGTGPPSYASLASGIRLLSSTLCEETRRGNILAKRKKVVSAYRYLRRSYPLRAFKLAWGLALCNVPGPIIR
ncbi:hypothetical protein CPC08DRAFT_328432 [Agrocybe pediades]|nr:hypothetical protein CPC08DRAFT_328432 [Agrocybe pediades]